MQKQDFRAGKETQDITKNCYQNVTEPLMEFRDEHKGRCGNTVDSSSADREYVEKLLCRLYIVVEENISRPDRRVVTSNQ